MKKLQILLPMLLMAICSFAQQKIITGRVTNKTTLEPLQGVSVQTKNKSVITDSSGKFSIQSSPGETITLSFVGMNSISVKVTNATADLNLIMNEGANKLNEVVVTGYISQRKKDLTGAVAVVELTPAVKNNTSGNVMQALQ